MSDGGGLRKRTRPGSFIPRAILRNRRLSFRARGVLCHLLDRPAGWDVRAEALAGESDADGRDAILSALRELGQQGYYRLERRRLANGQFAMGTAISEEPVEEWAADYAEYSGRAVPVIQQPDGSYMVRHKDGSLTADGFGAEHDPEPGDPPAPDEADHDPDGEVSLFPQVTPETGFPVPAEPVPGQPVPGKPDPGSTGSGEPGAIRRTEDEEPTRSFRTATPPECLYGGAGQNRGETGKSAKRRKTVERTPEEQRLFDIADDISRRWWEHWEREGVTIVGGRFPGFRQSIVLAALTAGATPDHVRQALTDCGDVFPALVKFQAALAAVQTGRRDTGQRRARGPAGIHRENQMPDTERQRLEDMFTYGAVGGKVIGHG